MAVQKYYDTLPAALMAFQHVEVALKLYIRDCDKIIQKAVKGNFHYAVREKEIWKKPLGRLIEEFSRRSNGTDIISVLKQLTKHRNFVAHSSYAVLVQDQDDPVKMKELSDRFKKRTELVNACLKALVIEYSRVTGESVPQEYLDKLYPKIGLL